MRRGRVGIVALVVVSAACGSGREGGPSATADPLVIRGGIARLHPPLEPRRAAVVLPAGASLLVYGGYAVDGSDIAPMGDGALYDAEAGAWTPVPPSPFATPWYLPAVVWTGREFLVVGSTCRRAHVEEDTAICGEDTEVSAAAYEPSARTWRVLPTPSQLRVAARRFPREPLHLTAVGFAAGNAVFSYDSDTAPAIAIDPGTGRALSIELPAPLTAPCVVAGRLFTFGNAGAGGVRAGGNPPGDPMRTFEWMPRGWVPVVGTPRPAPDPVYLDRVACAATGVAYVPVQAPPVGIGRDIWWFDPASTAWEHLPDLGNQGFPSAAQVAGVAGTRVIAVGTRLFVFPPGANAWTHATVPTGEIGAVGRWLLVNGYDEGGSERWNLSLVDVAPGAA